MSQQTDTHNFSSPPQVQCRWDWCREQFTDEFDLRDHVIRKHVEKSEPVPKQDLHIWQSSNGMWKGRQKDYLPTRRTTATVPETNLNQTAACMEVDPVPVPSNASPLAPAPAPKPASAHLEPYGIPRSQEATVVTQVFSPYVTSSDEQPRNDLANTPGSTSSQTHVRNASNESASLPQSHDYETVPGILSRNISQQTSSPATQPVEGSGSTAGSGSTTTTATTTTSDVVKERTTPLRVGIAFGVLPNVSSSSEDPGSSSGLFATKTEKGDAKPQMGSPNKKISDKSVRFGFGNR
ncbi:hypothetical protein NliqN6_6543 [Naganishia liquefaciens]|uniref:C2H2-type domain-containing protein n=1 Tax=Naganishia liquefaciens TaxID=104408 RepID=A0A8H3U064_9TREE|nr:hypothetical protein NliqN6_6543 [Naganishia liquefaciens]